MNKELAKTLTTALVQFIDRERPEGTMDCSNGECVSLEKAFTEENFESVETLIKKKLSRLTEFEQGIRDMIVNALTTVHESSNGQITSSVVMDYNTTHLLAAGLLELAKKEMPMPEDTVIFQKGVEEGRRLEREEVTKRSIQGYGDGKQDALRMVKDFVESYLESYKKKDGKELTDLYYKEFVKKPDPVPPGVAYKSPQCYTDVLVTPNTNSGTSTLKAEG